MTFQTVNKLIEAQTKSNPESIAAVYKNKTLTYQQLNHKANQLAYFLKDQGLKKSTPIALCVRRGFDLLIGTLAIFKAGGIFVPVSPDSPSNKFIYLTKKLGVRFFLIQTSIKLPLTEEDILCIKIDNVPGIEKYSGADAKDNAVSDKDLAYITHTSGTSGAPKGVMVTHANLLHALQGWQKVYQLGLFSDIHLQMANYTFDVFMGDFTRALCCGGRLILCDADDLLFPNKIFELINNNSVTCAEFVPAVIRLLINYLEKYQKKLDNMRLLICGSDSWTIAEYKKLKNLCNPKTKIINSYGTSETTIDSTYFDCLEIDNLDLKEEDLVPIGKPFPNTKIYILDKDNKSVAPFTIGEIFIGGKGVSEGYIEDLKLTNEKFIKYILPDNKIKKLYRTGDLAYYLNDNNIMFIGRSDTQIKINGLRIEPLAIESTLNLHHYIKESLVNCRHNSLIAYLVLEGENKPEIEELYLSLKSHLPYYMRPSRFFIIKKLPLNSNGKIDRGFNMDEIIVDELTVTDFDKANDLLEDNILEICRVVLKNDHIGRNSNLYDMGLNSLIFAQLICFLEDRLEKVSSHQYKNFCNISSNLTVADIRKFFHRNVDAINI